MSDDQRLAQAEQLLKEARAALRAAKGDRTSVIPRFRRRGDRGNRHLLPPLLSEPHEPPEGLILEPESNVWNG